MQSCGVQVTAQDIATAMAGLQLEIKQEAQFKDVQTGEMLPFSQITENMGVIDDTLKKLADARRKYRQVVNATNDKALADDASTEISGGRCTETFDELCNKKILLSLVVVGPSVKDKAQMFANEERIKYVICQISEFLYTMSVDAFNK